MSRPLLCLPLLGMALFAALSAFAQRQPSAPPFQPAAPPAAAPLAPAIAARIAHSYGRLPLQFEPNVGQTDKRVRFLTHAGGGTLFLTGTEAVLTLPQRSPQAVSARKPFDPQARLRHDKPAPTRFSVLRMKLTGANKPAAMTGLDKLPGTVNYFRGNDPKRWRSGIPTYRKARFAGVYRGVDMVYYGTQDGRLEYDFVVKPGADPRQIRLAFSGAKQVRVTRGGDLALRTDAGESLWHRPVTYQMVNGKRQTVACDYRVERNAGAPAIRFALAGYDTSKSLVIDPTLQYSTYLGGNGSSSIAVDSNGSAYVTGYTSDPGFPVTPGAFQTTLAGDPNAFVTKLNTSGSALVYSTYLGGSSSDLSGGGDFGYGIAVDSNGNAYVTGTTGSADFPVTPGAFQMVNRSPNSVAFVTKLNASGSALVYSTYLGGSLVDYGNSIAVDSSDSAYVTGVTASADFPVTPGAFQVNYGSYSNAFVTKLSASGSALIYSTYLGGNGSEGGDGSSSIAVDSNGNAYVTGGASSADFPVTAGAFQTTLMGSSNAFVTKLNASGSALVYSTYLGGSSTLMDMGGSFSGGDSGSGIVVDSNGNAYVTGTAGSADFPVTPGAFQTHRASGYDVFVTKLSADGSSLVYSTFLGGPFDDRGYGIALDHIGDAYITGVTATDDPYLSYFPETPDAFSVRGKVFVTKLNAGGSALIYSTGLGGNGPDIGYGIATDSSGNAYVTGVAASNNFPTTPGAFQTTDNFGGAVFVSKFGFEQPNPIPKLTGLSPASAPAGSPATTVMLTGTNFLTVTTVLVNGATRPATYVDATHLTVTLTAVDLNAQRALVLTTANPAPGGGVSNAQVFLVTATGTSNLRFVNVSLSRVDATNVTLTFAISNTGSGPGNAVRVLSGSVIRGRFSPAIDGLPLTIGTIAAGATSALVTLPLGNLTAGVLVTVKLNGTSAARVNFSSSYPLRVP